MDVSQENGTAAQTISNKFIIDSFILETSAAITLSAAQVSDAPPGLTNSIKMTVTTAAPTLVAGDYAHLQHDIEGWRVARLAFGTASAQPLSLGFWSKIHRTGTYSGAVRNSNDTRSYPFTFVQNVADTWQFNAVTVPGDTAGVWLGGNATGLVLNWTMACGSTYQAPANAWTTGNFSAAIGNTNGVAATTDTFQIAGVIVLPGIEVPSAARAPFIMRPYPEELRTCQRYFFRQILDGMNVNAAIYAAGGYLTLPWPFPTTMRAAPTLSTNWPSFAGNFTLAVFDSATLVCARLLLNAPVAGGNCAASWGAGGNNYLQGDARL